MEASGARPGRMCSDGAGGFRWGPRPPPGAASGVMLRASQRRLRHPNMRVENHEQSIRQHDLPPRIRYTDNESPSEFDLASKAARGYGSRGSRGRSAVRDHELKESTLESAVHGEPFGSVRS